jgi:hypothetical protein
MTWLQNPCDRARARKKGEIKKLFKRRKTRKTFKKNFYYFEKFLNKKNFSKKTFITLKKKNRSKFKTVFGGPAKWQLGPPGHLCRGPSRVCF